MFLNFCGYKLYNIVFIVSMNVYLYLFTLTARKIFDRQKNIKNNLLHSIWKKKIIRKIGFAPHTCDMHNVFFQSKMCAIIFQFFYKYIYLLNPSRSIFICIFFYIYYFYWIFDCNFFVKQNWENFIRNTSFNIILSVDFVVSYSVDFQFSRCKRGIIDTVWLLFFFFQFADFMRRVKRIFVHEFTCHKCVRHLPSRHDLHLSF